MSGLIDVHTHLAALPADGNGCRMSAKMRRSPAFRMTALRFGLPLEAPALANRRYLEALIAALDASRRVASVVILGMDGAYDRAGRLDESRTDFLISNDYVFSCAARDRRLLPGVSINPARADAAEELERCAARGAALVKTLAPAQAFDPAQPRFRPFFRRLGELRLPLLSHVGFEFSLIGNDQSVGDLERLIPALEEGATVIAAHGCSSGLFLFEKHFALMLELVRRFPRFFIDLSALTLPNRVGVLFRLRRHPELSDRLVFGTDYPLPCLSYPALAGGWGAFRRAASAPSPFDLQAEVLDALGIQARADPRELLAPACFSSGPKTG